MADLIENWINKEVKLSKIVTNIEEDFSNGYLFGELLNKFNQITNFNEYKNKDESGIKVTNFKLLEKALRDMDIKIEKGRIFDIINKKRGVATRFLYLIKKNLAEKFINLENIDLKKSPLIHETYNNAMYFATRDQNIIEAYKENPIIQSLDLHTLKSNRPKLLSIKDPKFKFDKFKKDQAEKIINDEKMQNEFLKIQQEKTAKEINNLESNIHEYKNNTDLAQLNDWKKNMEIKKKFELRLHNELFSQANYFKSLVFESIDNSQKEEKIQIENFEKNLSRLGLDTSNAEQKLKKSNKAALSGEIILQKIREKIEANAIAKKERDRRKRKILIDQKKAQEELLITDKKNVLNENEGNNNLNNALNNLATEIAEAKFNEFKSWKELHNINLESDIQKQKETENYEKEKNKDYEKEFAEFFSERDKLKKFNKEEFIRKVYSEDKAQKQKEMELRLAKRNKNLIPVKLITEQIIKIAEEVFKFQTDTNVELLEQIYWKDLMRCFINNTPLEERFGKQQVKSAVENYFDASIINNNDKKSENAENVSRSKFDDSQQDISLNNLNSFNNTVVNNVSFGSVIEGVFEECEMFDYLNFIGQYKTQNLIPSSMLNKMLDMFEIMGSDIALLVGVGSKFEKITDAYKEYEPTDDDIENLTIPANYVKNYNLNDIINILIDIKFTNANINQEMAIQSNLVSNNNNNLLGITNMNVNNNILNITSNSGTFNINNANINNNTNNNLAINTIHGSNLHSSISNFDSLKKNNNINNDNTNALTNTNSLIKNHNIQNIFNNIPLKILFLGKKFSGRKTQIRLLCENFPLKFYNVEELISKNISLLEELEIPFDENPKFKNLKKNELEKASAERVIEEAKFEPIKPFVKAIKEYKDKSQNVPDNVIFDFLFEIIKVDFPEKSNSQLIEELNNKNKKKKEIIEELNKIKEEKLKGAAAIVKNPNVKNETFYINELQKLNIETNKGFVLLDFPGNLEQAKFFEYKINNFISEIERPKNFISQIKENFGVILDKIPKPSHNKSLTPGAFDIVFYLESSNDEIIRRAKNRKIDPNTGIIYHMEDNPPPNEDKKLNERLINYEENLNYEALLHNSNKFNLESDKFIEFYEAFGFEKCNFKTLHKFLFGLTNNNQKEALNASNLLNVNNKNLILNTDRSEKTVMTKDVNILSSNANNNLNLSNNHNNKKDVKEQILSTNAEMKEIVLHMIKVNEERESEFLASATLNSKDNNIITNFAGKESVANSTKTHLNLIATNNDIANSRRNSNANQFNLKDFQKSKEQIATNTNTINNANFNNNNNNNNHITQSNIQLNTEIENKTNNLHSKNNFSLIQKNQTHNIQNLDEEDFNKYLKKLEEAKRKLAAFTVESIFNQWAKMHENYTCGVKNFFKNLRKQKENIILTFNRMQEKFVEFLRRPSRKMVDINKFQKKYNKFFDEYPQLKGDEQVKSEFLNDISDLSDRIWEVIEERKIEAINERKKIMDSGYVEKEMEKFYVNLEKLYLLEVEKFVTNVNTIRDFYCNMDLKFSNTLESLGFSPIEIIKDSELVSLPLYADGFNSTRNIGNDRITELRGGKDLKNSLKDKQEKYRNKKNEINNSSNDQNLNDDKYPRVQKLFKNSIKLILKLDDSLKSMEKISKSNAINNISSESSIRKISRIHIRRNQETTFVDDKREIFIYEEELKNSLKFEKNKFKFRVTYLKFWAIDYFENLRKISKTVYDKLDDWIISTIKAENDAMNNLVAIFDGCIEKEMRLRVDFEMDSFDIYKLIEINDKIEIIATELPFRELSEKTCIDYDVFLKVYGEIKDYQISKNYIRSQTFVDLVIKKYLIDNQGLGLPNIFKHLSFYNIKKFLTFMENVPYYQNQNSTENKIDFNDVINIKETFSLLLVFESKIITEAHEKMLISQAANHLENKDYLSKENFLNVEFWFERDPNVNGKSADDEFVIPSRLKESLFEINKEENGLINFTNVINILLLKSLARPVNIEELRKLNKSYGEVLLL